MTRTRRLRSLFSLLLVAPAVSLLACAGGQLASYPERLPAPPTVRPSEEPDVVFRPPRAYAPPTRGNGRSGPGLARPVLRQAERGKTLRLDAHRGEWFRVSARGGWVHESVVARVPARVPKRTRRPPETAGQTLGVWRDNAGALLLQITIVRKGDTYVARFRGLQGLSFTRPLVPTPPPRSNQRRAFRDPSSERGKIYAISRNGDLELFDNRGFLRSARRETNR